MADMLQDKGRGGYKAFELRQIVHKNARYQRELEDLDFDKVKVSDLLEPCNNDKHWVRGNIYPRVSRENWSAQKQHQELTCKASSVGGNLLFPRIFRVADSLCNDDEFVVNSLEDAAMICLNGRIPAEEVALFSRASIGAPWKIPRTLPRAAKINALLERSMAAQMNTLTDTEFNKCFMSGDSLAVCGVVHTVLKYAGINSEFKTGVLKVGDKGLPMVWLTIHGQLVDNTHHYWPGGTSAAGDVCDEIFELKRVEMYLEEDPTTTELPLVKQIGSRTCISDPRLLKAYATPENIGKFLAVRKGHPNAYPNFQLYALSLMLSMSTMDCSLMLAEKSRDHPPFRLLNQCWTCDKKSWHLKTCVECREAKYCGRTCQRADWPVHKLLHQDIRANSQFHTSSLYGGGCFEASAPATA